MTLFRFGMVLIAIGIIWLVLMLFVAVSMS